MSDPKIEKILAKVAENQQRREEYREELLQRIDARKTVRTWSSCSGKPLSDPMDAA